MDRIAKDTGGVHIDAELTYLNPSIAQLLNCSSNQRARR
jgi:hypothetical protein